jgi:hypothetical protein
MEIPTMDLVAITPAAPLLLHLLPQLLLHLLLLVVPLVLLLV